MDVQPCCHVDRLQSDDMFWKFEEGIGQTLNRRRENYCVKYLLMQCKESMDSYTREVENCEKNQISLQKAASKTSAISKPILMAGKVKLYRWKTGG